MGDLLQISISKPIVTHHPYQPISNQFATCLCFCCIFFILWLAKLPPWTFVATDVMSGTKAHATTPSRWENWRKNVSKTGRLRRPQNLSLHHFEESVAGFLRTIKNYDPQDTNRLLQAAHFASNTTFLGCLRCKHILLSTSDACINTYRISLLYIYYLIHWRLDTFARMPRISEKTNAYKAFWSVSALRFKAHQRRVWC